MFRSPCLFNAYLICIALFFPGCGFDDHQGGEGLLSPREKELLAAQPKVMNTILEEQFGESLFRNGLTSTAGFPRLAFDYLPKLSESSMDRLLRSGIGPFTKQNKPRFLKELWPDLRLDNPKADYYFYCTNIWYFAQDLDIKESQCPDYLVLVVEGGVIKDYIHRASIPY